MKNIQTEQLPSFQDDRGWLIQLFDENSKWKRAYIVSNWDLDAIRAFHLNVGEEKGYVCLKGAVKFIAWSDEGKEGKKEFVLSEKKPEMLVVPENTYHGWKAFTKDTVLLGLSTASMEDHKEQRLPWDAFAGENQWVVKHR